MSDIPLIRLRSAIVIFVLNSFFVMYVSASPITISNDSPAKIELGPHYQLLVDKQHKISITDILSVHHKAIFQPLPEGKYNLGYRPETHWFQVDINNVSDDQIDRLLEFHFPLLDSLSTYLVDKSSNLILSHYQTGDKQAFNERYYQHPNFVLPLSLPAQTNLSLYIRIRTEGSMTAGSSLWQPEIFPEQNRTEYFYINLYIGLLVGLICYNLLLFLSLREISYFYYVLFASSILLAVGSFNGLWFELIWPNMPLWHNLSVPIGFSLTGVFAALFSRSFLQTPTKAPLLDKAFSFVALAFTLTILASPFTSLLVIAPAISMIAIALALTSIVSGITLSIRGDRFALIYLIAWVIFMLGTVLFSARNVGWVPSNTLTRYSIVLGSALEMILLSFALAQRINFFRTENDKSRQQAFQSHSKLIEVLRNSEIDLTQRVKKRTQALVNANKKLLAQEHELKKLAHYDSLTGLANRALIIEQLNLLINHCKREQTKLAVLFLDLDNFKPINDEFGHKAGDELLVATADKLRYILRDSDVVGRLGGDEFIVLLESSDGAINAEEVAEKIKDTVSQPVTINGISMQVAVSIGIAIYPDDGDSADSLMSISDDAMYLDKGKQKNVRAE